MAKRSNWGILVFIPAVLLLGAGYWFFGFSNADYNAAALGRIFLYIGLISGFVVPLLAHFSYPRVHNLKVFLAGYLTGVAALGFFLLNRPYAIFPPISGNLIPGIYLFIIAGLFLSILLPTFLKYRQTRMLTIILLGVELVVMGILRFGALSIFELNAIRSFGMFQWVALIPATLTITILVLSFLALKMKFHLGGVLGGTMLLFCGGWYGDSLMHFFSRWRPALPGSRFDLLDPYIFAVATVFLGIGILLHWIVRMEHRASYDPLLRIYNRDYCEKILSEQVGMRTSPPFGIAIVDIDNFKKVNDTYGHKVGDEVLIRVARILSTELVPEGVICRYGGDEFVVFFPRKNSKRVKVIMEKARKKVKGAIVRSGNRKVKVSLSIGVSHREHTSKHLREVLKAADKALYRAKKQGRDQVRYSTG